MTGVTAHFRPPAPAAAVAALLRHARVDDPAAEPDAALYLDAAERAFEAAAGRLLRPTLCTWWAPFNVTTRLPVPDVGFGTVDMTYLTAGDLAADELPRVPGWDPLAAPGVAYWRAGGWTTVVVPPAPAGPEFAGPAAVPRPVLVTFTAGYGTSDGYAPGAEPADVRAAVHLLAAHYLRRREAYQPADFKELPAGFRAVCDRHAARPGWVG